MSRLLIRYIPVFFLAFCSGLSAQQVRFEHLTLEDGLSQSTVNAIFQDSRGFMWFGTGNGLNKYDGYGFTVYRHAPNDTSSLSGDWITAIHEDRHGALWVGTNDGLNKFDPATGRSLRIRSIREDPQSLSHHDINTIYEDRTGSLWVGTSFGLNRMRVDSSGTIRFQRYFANQNGDIGLSHNNIRSMCEDRAGNLWVATYGGGLNRFDPTRSKVDHFFRGLSTEKVVPTMPSSNLMTTLYCDEAGMIWSGSDGGGVNRFDPHTATWEHFGYNPEYPESLGGLHVRDIAPGPPGKLWIGTFTGLVLLDVNSGESKTFRHSPEEPASLTSNDIAVLYRDHTGTLWAGSVLGGVDKFDPLKNRFRKHTHDSRTAAGRKNRLIYSFYEDGDGLIWVGSRQGLNLFDPRTQDFLEVKIASTARGPYVIMDIHEDRNGTLWIATNNDGLYEFQRSRHGNKAVLELQARYTADSIGSNLLWTIYEDENGILWIGTRNAGLTRFDPGTKTLTRYVHRLDKNSISHNSVRAIYKDRTGRFWLGTGGGLNRFDPKAEAFTHYKHDPDDPNSLSHDSVTSIYEDSAGDLWLSTYGGGINKFVLSSDQPYFVRYTEENGLPNNVIYSILADDHGNLWTSSNKGLTKFDPETETFENYDFNDGLQSNEFNTGAYLETDSGEMYFGGINGFNVFHPDSIRINPNIPPVVITSFKVFDDAIEQADLNQPLELSHDRNSVSFEFVALDYTNSHQNQYAYKLEGLDRDWIYCGTRRYGSYANLPPGEYVLRVKGSNSDGVWNEAGQALRFVILPPLWQRAWFKVLAVLMIGGAIYAGYRLRMRALATQKRKLEQTVHEKTAELRSQKRLIEEQAEKLSELDRMKSRFFTNISHEFRTPLTLILTPLEQMLANGYDDQSKAVFSTMRRNARRLLRLINQLLELAKIENDQMALSRAPGDLVAFLRGTVASFESLAEQKQVDLSFRCELEHLPCCLDYDKLEQIVYNLLSNALKFTPQPGAVSVTLALVPVRGRLDRHPEKKIQLTVKDTGRGMTREQRARVFDRFYQHHDSDTREFEGTGIGLALTKELVEAHDGAISVQSQRGEGSEFMIRLPLYPASLDECRQPRLTHAEQRDTIAPASDMGPPDVCDDEEQPLVLVVEDNPDMRAYIKDKLAADYQIITAADGAVGIATAREMLPDLVISDVMMPGADGFELCRALKTDEKSSHIPIILLTAKAADQNKLEGLQIGADDYLIKPFDLDQLRVRINNLITQRRRLRQRFRREMILEPKEIAATPADEQFLRKVAQHIEERLADDQFGADELNAYFNMSRSQFYRKIRALTGSSPIQLIRTMRLKRAKQLLEQQAGTISEIAFQVGFNNLSYFSKSFRDVFGHLPSEHVAS